MDHHHRADMAVKAPRAIHPAVIDAPEDFQPTVDPFDRGASGVQAFELFGRARNAREASQVDLLLDAHGQAILSFAVASRIAGAIEAMMPSRAAILERATLRLVADVGHWMTHWRVADAILTKDRARLIVDDVQGRAAAEHLLWLFELEIAILDDRRDLFVVQEFMNRAIICCLVVRQRLD